MLGGCCGTTPAHIKAMSDAVRAEVTPAQVQPKNDTIITSYTHSVIFDGKTDSADKVKAHKNGNYHSPLGKMG